MPGREEVEVKPALVWVRGLIPRLQVLTLLHEAEGREVLRQVADVLEEYARTLEDAPPEEMS